MIPIALGMKVANDPGEVGDMFMVEILTDKFTAGLKGKSETDNRIFHTQAAENQNSLTVIMMIIEITCLSSFLPHNCNRVVGVVCLMVT